MNKLVDQYYETLATSEPILFDTPEQAILDLDARLTQIESQVQQIALNTLKMAEHIRDLRAQSTAPAQSAIILPDRFN